VGPLGGALEARGIEASGGRLTAEVRGEVELDGRILVLRRVHAHYRIRAPRSAQATVERVHGFHADNCPVARSIRDAIDVTTTFELVDGAGEPEADVSGDPNQPVA
jgi:organic hydroperoxide reductase OsmC/OhrA